MRRLPAWLLAALLVSSCAEPPNKEMDQAQGALDAARAAGAERYAAEQFTAASEALKQANAAVAQGDYRLALNHALDSRERAQNAARDAADNRARVRGEVEREMAEVAALLAQASSRITAAEAARVPRRALREPQQQLAQVNADVQKAGAAIEQDDYPGAQPVLRGMKERIAQIVTAVDALTNAQTSRRRR